MEIKHKRHAGTDDIRFADGDFHVDRLRVIGVFCLLDVEEDIAQPVGYDDGEELDVLDGLEEQGAAEIENYPQGVPLEGSLYAPEYLEVKDKYSYFYGGNTPLLTVRTGNPGPKLLVLRDSYMDSLSPFLFPHFSEIHILDLRYYHTSLKACLEEQGFDSVLVCYSVKNFVEDSNIFLAAY